MSAPSARHLIALALAEDEAHRDVTSRAIFPARHRSRAVIDAKQDLVICGLEIAAAVFRRAGLDFVPAVTDIQAVFPFYNSPLDLLPDAKALAASTVAIKEWLGLIIYRERGWA